MIPIFSKEFIAKWKKAMKYYKADPASGCDLFKDKGCSHIDSLLCDYPGCSMLKVYEDNIRDEIMKEYYQAKENRLRESVRPRKYEDNRSSKDIEVEKQLSLRMEYSLLFGADLPEDIGIDVNERVKELPSYKNSHDNI